MADDQCTCVECAVDSGYISKIEGEVIELYVLTKETAQSEKLDLWLGDECEQDHNHSKSKSCEFQFKCANCGDIYESLLYAEECCSAWECNFCGWTHTSGSWSSARTMAAECCVTSCDDCGATGWPDHIDSHDCHPAEDYDYDEDGPHSPKMRSTSPWADRNLDFTYPVDPTTNKIEEFTTVWGFDPKQHDVVQASADYYLLEAISAGLVGTTDGEGNRVLPISEVTTFRVICNEAQYLLDQLVKEWDPILQAYTHFACGGELRHHTAVGNKVLSSKRKSAWIGWKYLFAEVGNQALLDAYDLFMEFSSGTFGGKPWADACKILHSRLTGKISAQMFLDRIFNHQHNGGTFLNKVTWKGDIFTNYSVEDMMQHHPLDEMQSTVLPAHGAEPEPNYPTLLAYASPQVVRLFNDSYRYAAQAAVEIGATLTRRRTRPSKGLTRYVKFNKTSFENQIKEQVVNALLQPFNHLNTIKGQESALKTFYKGAAKEAKKNAELEAAGKLKPESCDCGVPGCDYTLKQSGYQNYYTSIVKDYEEAIANMYKELGPKLEKAIKVAFVDGALSKMDWNYAQKSYYFRPYYWKQIKEFYGVK